MRASLVLHPQAHCPSLDAIEAEVARPRPNALSLRYVLRGRIDALALPVVAAAAPLRADGLWRRTCVEAFIAREGAPGYLEFNFAPSTQWAAYAFDAYRAGMRPLDLAHPPRIRVAESAAALEIAAAIEAPLGGRLRLALSAVIEAKGGEKSYWALAHPPGVADFHHREGFILDLPDTEHA